MAKLIHEQKTLKSLYFIFVFRDDYFCNLFVESGL